MLDAIKDLVEQDPGLRALTDQFRERADRLSKGALDNNGLGDENRLLDEIIPILAAGSISQEIRSIWSSQVDYEAAVRSDQIKSGLKEDRLHYVPTIVIGSGVNGAAFNGGHSLFGETLTVERNDKLGGQFRKYGGAAFKINSSNSRVKREIPGAIANEDFNSLGIDSPLQLCQISGNFFPDNETLGLAVATNQLLTSSTILGTEVTKIERNADSMNGGRLLVHIRDLETNEAFTVSTDNVVISTGLGQEHFGGLERNQDFNQILQGEQRKELSDRSIYSYQDFLTHFGSNNFPLDNFVGKRVAIVGGGHSSYTVLENLVGQGPAPKGSVAALGGPASIEVIGSKFSNLEEFLKNEYERYLALGIVLPALNAKEGARKSLVNLHKGERVNGVVKTGDNFDLKVRNKETGVESTVQADIIIFCVGFENRTFDLIEGITPDETLWVYGRDRCEIEKFLNGAKILSVTSETDSIVDITRDDSIDRERIFRQIEEDEIREILFEKDSKIVSMLLCSEDEVNARVDSQEYIEHCVTAEGLRDETKKPNKISELPRFYHGGTGHEIGRWIPGGGVYLIGPAAELPLGEDDQSRRDIAGAPGVTVSIVNNQDDATALGRFLGSRSKHLQNDLRGLPKIIPPANYDLMQGPNLPITQSEAHLLSRLLKFRHFSENSANISFKLREPNRISVDGDLSNPAINRALNDPLLHDLLRAGYIVTC